MDFEIIQTLSSFLEKCETAEEKKKIKKEIEYLQFRMCCFQDDGK